MVVPRGQKLEAAQANKLEDLASTLKRLKDEIRDYQCPHCGALLTERGGDCDHYYEAFECGYVNTDGCGKRPCPWDPKFPRFEDYELQFVSTKTAGEKSWTCIANPKTDMARWLSLIAYGRTKEESEQRIRAEYERNARKEKKVIKKQSGRVKANLIICQPPLPVAWLGCWRGILSGRVALNVDLLAAVLGDVDLQGGRVPRQSPNSGEGFNRPDKPRLRWTTTVCPYTRPR